MLQLTVRLRRGNFNLSTDLSVHDEGTGVLGGSGAGKSTFLGLIAGTLRPQQGRIVLDGKILFDSSKGILVPRHQRPVGAVLQQDRLPGRGRVKDNVFAAYDATPVARRVLRLDPVIEILGLGALMERYTHELSAGEAQRLALARALLTSPRMLVLDEPFAPLGTHFRSQLEPLLRRVQGEWRIPILYASHSLGQILELTDRLIVLEDGQVLNSGSLQQLAHDPVAIGALGLRAATNILEVTVVRHEFDDGCTLATSFAVPLTLPLRPHLAPGSQVRVTVGAAEIALSRHYLPGISIQNQIKGRICAIITNGSTTIVQVDCGAVLLAGITPRACREMGLQEGEEVYCLAKAQSFSYLAESAVAGLPIVAAETRIH